MSSAVYLGKNMIAVPQKRKPSMHDLFYRVEAMGALTMTTKSGAYKVQLIIPGEKYPLVSIKKDFYDCLYDLYRKIEKKTKKYDENYLYEKNYL